MERKAGGTEADLGSFAIFSIRNQRDVEYVASPPTVERWWNLFTVLVIGFRVLRINYFFEFYSFSPVIMRVNLRIAPLLGLCRNKQRRLCSQEHSPLHFEPDDLSSPPSFPIVTILSSCLNSSHMVPLCVVCQCGFDILFNNSLWLCFLWQYF